MQTKLTPIKNNFLLIKEKFLSFKIEDGLFFPFFRVSIGLFCLVHLLSIIQDFGLLYTNNGLIPLNVLSVMKTEYMPSYNYLQNTLSRIGISPAVFANCYITLFFIGCVALMLGFLTRFFSLFLLFLHILVFQSSSPYMYGVEFFKSIALFYCFVFPVGTKMSVDQLLSKKLEVNPSPYRNLLKIHMSIVYFTSGIDKCFGINWWNGESIWKAIHLPGFKSNLIENYEIFIQYPILPLLFGIGTMIIEVFYPICMSIKKTTTLWLALTVSLHVGIIISLNLYFFGLLMILLNLSAFLALEENKKHV